MAMLVLIGFVASYQTLRDLALFPGEFAPWLAPAVPLSFDLGIVILSLKVVLAAREGRTAVCLRLLVVGLSAATVVANVSAASSVLGGMMHAVPPAMFVICFESVAVSARRRSLSEAGRAASSVPRLPLVVWLLDPGGTWRRWRLLLLQATVEHPSGPPATGRAPGLRPERTKRAPQRFGTESLRAMASSDSTTASAVANGTDLATERLHIARDALRHSPRLTAADLSKILTAAGHRCSVRTAQRVKVTALTGEPAPGGSLGPASA
jgi:hypothetical protein